MKEDLHLFLVYDLEYATTYNIETSWLFFNQVKSIIENNAYFGNEIVHFRADFPIDINTAKDDIVSIVLLIFLFEKSM